MTTVHQKEDVSSKKRMCPPKKRMCCNKYNCLYKKDGMVGIYMAASNIYWVAWIREGCMLNNERRVYKKKRVCFFLRKALFIAYID